MKQQNKWLAGALAVASGLIIANSAQAQYITGDPTLDNTTSTGGSFLTTSVGANGLTLTGSGYSYGGYTVPVEQAFNPADNEIIFTYTINSPTPGTTGGDYTLGNAWTWYSLQPLIDTVGGGTTNLVRYFGYDGYNLSYGFPSGQGVANQDAGYVYSNGVVTETAPLTAATEANLAAGGTVDYFQLSMDPTTTLPDGFGFTVNSIELVVAPEPSTLALVGLGLGVVGLLIARRRVKVS